MGGDLDLRVVSLQRLDVGFQDIWMVNKMHISTW